MHAGGNTVEITTEAAISDFTEYHPPDEKLSTGMFAFLFIVIYYAVYSIHLFLCLTCSMFALFATHELPWY